MIIPTNEHCRKVLDELADEPALTDFEQSFIESNRERLFFTDRQREIIAELCQKYDV